MTTVIDKPMDDGTTLEELCAALNIAKAQEASAKSRRVEDEWLLIASAITSKPGKVSVKLDTLVVGAV